MMIEDDELRSLYKLSGEERLQKLEAGLLRLEEQPQDQETLKQLLQETHSLKGDSRAVGLEAIADLTHAVERILKRVQHHETGLTPALNARLYQGLNAIAQLIHEATTGEAIQVDVTEVLQVLSDAPASDREAIVSIHANPIDLNPIDLNSIDLNSSHSNLIADEELREIYRITSEERLQKLESGLGQLAKHPDDPAILEGLRRQIHSLKGDSRVVGLETVATLAQQFEDVLKRLQAQAGMTGAASISGAAGDCLYVGLDAIGQLIYAAVTNQPCPLDVAQVLEYLQSVLATLPAPDAAVSVELAAIPPEGEPELEAAELPAPELEVPLLSSIMQETIEDPELRSVFKATSEERLQKLEAGLAQLERQPTDLSVLAELLREAHSLKGDARSTGLESIETLTHQIEEIFEQIQKQEIAFTAGLCDRLYVSLDAVGQLVQAAVTGRPRPVDVAQILHGLRTAISTEAARQPAVLAPSDRVETEALTAAPTLDEPYRIDTVRVQTRDLDVLMTQTEELTVTRIQIAQMQTQAKQLANLWEEWQGHKSRDTYAGGTASSKDTYAEGLEALISSLSTATQENSAKLDRVAETLREKVYNLRLLPLSNVFQQFSRTVRELARQQSKAVEFIIEGGETTADKRILEGIKDALTHLIRNAIDHGIETPEERAKRGKPALARIWLRGYQSATGAVIEVADDGRGLDLEQIKQTAIKRRLYRPEVLEAMTPSQIRALILTPGFSTRTFITELSGRGVGLDVVQTQVERLNGTIEIESTPEQGCTFRLHLRTSLATLNVVFVEVQGIIHALPFEFLQTTLLVAPEQITATETHNTILWNDQPVPVANLADVLELSKSPAYSLAARSTAQLGDRRSCLIFRIGEEQAGFLVDRLLEMQEIVIKPQSWLLKRVRNVLGATTLASGEVCMILNPADLLKSFRQPIDASLPLQPEALTQSKPVILLVEDSMPVQIQERRLFERAGYEVVVANDGLEGYRTLRTRRFDAVVSDVEMPNLDGLSLTARIRQHPEYQQLPIILVTTLSGEEDRKRGADAGATAYIPKGKFNQEVLLETIARLI